MKNYGHLRTKEVRLTVNYKQDWREMTPSKQLRVSVRLRYLKWSKMTNSRAVHCPAASPPKNHYLAAMKAKLVKEKVHDQEISNFNPVSPNNEQLHKGRTWETRWSLLTSNESDSEFYTTAGKEVPKNYFYQSVHVLQFHHPHRQHLHSL